jgi:beta-phosphoglucomutase-like phosphatase (HAD superfamily)
MTVSTIFDFNGVLVDDESVHIAAFREVVAPLGVVFDDATYTARYLGFDDAGAFRAMLEDAGKEASDEQVARLIAAKKPLYMKLIAGALVVFDGAPELVRRRAALGPVGIVSGALLGEIEHALGVMGVRGAVSFIVAADDTKRCKPDPEGYLRALEVLEKSGAASARAGVIVIEDSLAGIESAKAAGLRCAAVAHSYPAPSLRAAGADIVVERLADLTDELLDYVPPAHGPASGGPSQR